MLVAKHSCYGINGVIQHWKFHAGNTRFIAGKINSRIKRIGIHFQKVSGSHGNSSLSPIMRYFKRWIGNAIKPNQPKKHNPNPNISRHFLHPAKLADLERRMEKVEYRIENVEFAQSAT